MKQYLLCTVLLHESGQVFPYDIDTTSIYLYFPPNSCSEVWLLNSLSLLSHRTRHAIKQSYLRVVTPAASKLMQ